MYPIRNPQSHLIPKFTFSVSSLGTSRRRLQIEMPQVTSLPKVSKGTFPDRLFANPCSFPGAQGLCPWSHTFVHSKSGSVEGKPGKCCGKSLATTVAVETMAGCSPAVRWYCKLRPRESSREKGYAPWCPSTAGAHIHVMADQQTANFRCTEHLLVNVQTTCNVLCIFLYIICVQGWH